MGQAVGGTFQSSSDAHVFPPRQGKVLGRRFLHGSPVCRWAWRSLDRFGASARRLPHAASELCCNAAGTNRALDCLRSRDPDLFSTDVDGFVCIEQRTAVKVYGLTRGFSGSDFHHFRVTVLRNEHEPGENAVFGVAGWFPLGAMDLLLGASYRHVARRRDQTAAVPQQHAGMREASSRKRQALHLLRPRNANRDAAANLRRGPAGRDKRQFGWTDCHHRR